MKYRFMSEQAGTHSVEKMAEVLGVGRGGYYAWRGRPESGRHRRRVELTERIRAIQNRVRYRYGSPRVTKELQLGGERVGQNLVARLMRQASLGARPRKRFRATTRSSELQVPAENLLGRRFGVSGANEAWVSDITYVATAEGWLYVCVMLDLFSRRVVGWSMGRGLGTELVMRALMMAILRRRPPRGVLVHSDRGVQYGSRAFRRVLNAHGMRQSMSRKGDCWDNACAEVFFKSLKTELVQGQVFRSRAEAQAAIFEYIEVFYNRERLHSYLGYVSPIEFERRKAEQVA
jgi:transposase InsO family protein